VRSSRSTPAISSPVQDADIATNPGRIARRALGDERLARNRKTRCARGSYRWDVAFDRITTDQAVMAGASCIRGMRVPVATVVAMIEDGMTPDEILDDLPYLEREDIGAALRFTRADHRFACDAGMIAPRHAPCRRRPPTCSLRTSRTMSNNGDGCGRGVSVGWTTDNLLALYSG
jgi:uncharacterized protein (DUF433 family)